MKTTFTKLHTPIYSIIDLNDTDKLILSFILSHYDNNQEFFYTDVQLMEIFNYKKDKVRRSLMRLKSNEYISITNSKEHYKNENKWGNRRIITITDKTINLINGDIVITPSDTPNTLIIVNNKIKKREIKMETPKFNVNEFIKNSEYYNTIEESRREGMLKYFSTFTSEEDVVAEIKKLQQKEVKKQLKLKNNTITPVVEESVVNEPETADDMITYFKQLQQQPQENEVVEEVKENTPTKQVKEPVVEKVETSINEVKEYLNIEIRGYKGLKYIVDEMAQYIVNNAIGATKMDKMELITLANQFNVV
jgi:hypothetical protein